MSKYWIILALSWLNPVSLQYINTAGQGDVSDTGLHSYASFYHLPQSDDSLGDITQFYRQEDGFQQLDDLQRKRRTVPVAADFSQTDRPKDKISEPQWLPNLLDSDKTIYVLSDNMKNPIIVQEYVRSLDNNSIFTSLNKKSFSPWGGKRDGKPVFEHMWSWRRPHAVKEPNMPKSTKRVRFSPWGGKRGSPLIMKPGTKGSKIIFSTAPDLTRFMSKYFPNGERLNLAGFQLIQTLDKRHPIRVLALSTKLNDRFPRNNNNIPLHTLFESLPKVFKPGQPYVNVNVKQDGKRKVKFSAWGGKRAPPIIGPIWTPSGDIQDNSLGSLMPQLMLQDKDKNIMEKDN